MSVTFRVGERGNVTTRAITGIGAGTGVVSWTVGGALTSPVGAVFEISGNSTAENNVVGYTCVAATATSVTLRPAPNNASTNGTLAIKTRTVAKGGTDTVTSVLALGGGLSLIVANVATASFLTDGVVRNDFIQVTGSSIAANNGLWLVHGAPLSENMVVVRPPDGGAGMTTEAVGTGSVAVRAGICAVLITNEAALSWSFIATNGVAVAGPLGSVVGSGAMSDYVQRITNVGNFALVVVSGVGGITINQSGLGGDAEWESENECAFAVRTVNPGAGGDVLTNGPLDITASAGANFTNIRLGVQTGDENSADLGSVWVGFISDIGATRARWFMYGSYFHHLTNQFTSQPGSETVSSVVRRNLLLAAGGSHLIRNASFYGTAPLILLGAADIQNLVLPSYTSVGSITTSVTIEDLLISDLATGPLLALAPCVLLNPREDYDLTDGFFDGAWHKDYTYNRRHVVLPSGGCQPEPLEGATVTITQLSSVCAETVIFTGLTDANGRINAGLGAQLRRQSSSSLVETELNTHRVQVSAPGILPVTWLITMSSRDESDAAVTPAVSLTGSPVSVEVVTVPVEVEVVTPVVTVDTGTGVVEVEPL